MNPGKRYLQPVMVPGEEEGGREGGNTEATQKYRKVGENSERTKKARENRKGEEERIEKSKSKTERIREVKAGR